MLLESSLGRDKVSEELITFSIEWGMSSEVLVVQETGKDSVISQN